MFAVFSSGGKQHLAFGIEVRIPDVDLQQEAIELRLGQRIGSFLLQRVLGRQHVKRQGQVVGMTRNRHTAFGLGIHRCIGSNLARMELRVALEEWMAAFPDFELADPDTVTWSTGQVRGPRQLPLRFLA